MYDFLLGTIIYLCILPPVLSTEECIKAVLGKRDSVYPSEGGSLSLSCDIQHCGDTWTGQWVWTYSDNTDKKLIENSDRHSLTNVKLSANQTRLFLNFLSVNQSDEGSYGCLVTWGQGLTAQGHYTYVNVTAAFPTKRNLLHRFLVLACACLCFPIILGLAHLISGVKPQPQPLPRTQFTYAHEFRDQPHSPPKPPPRCPVPKKRSDFPHKASPHSKQKTEVVYADISQNALRQQGAIREPTHSTVYSSVRFS